MNYLPSEQQEQEAFCQWLAIHPDLKDSYFSIPNGEMRPKKLIKKKDGSYKYICPTGIKLKKAGLRKGAFDLFIAYPTITYHGLFIEMKTKKGKETEEQKKFKYDMQKKGFCAEFCYGFYEAISLVNNYIKGNFCGD